MDPIKILKRAWNIVWTYRVLWIFGFILALGAAGSSGGNGNSGSRYSINNREEMQMPRDVQETFGNFGQLLQETLDEGISALGISEHELTALLWVGIAFVLLMIVFGVLVSIARYVSETSVIRMVDEYEASGTQLSFREGWRLGWNRTAWRLFLIDFLVSLPMLLLLVVLGIGGFVAYKSYAVRSTGDEVFSLMLGFGALVLAAFFVMMLVSVFLRLLRHFFWRAVALENLGVRDSLRAGYQLFRQNLKDAGIMWLVMVGVGIAWALATIIAIVVSLPLIAITLIVGVVVAAIPGLLLFGFFNVFLSGYLPWVATGLFVLPLLLGIGFAPWTLLNGWAQTFTSTVWTLVYREFRALPKLTPAVDTEIMQLEE